MALRWDALLARHTAAELHGVLAGSRARALRLDGATRELALLLEDRTLRWSLHPAAGWPRVLGPTTPSEQDLPLRGRVVAVDSPPDERIVRIHLTPAAGRPVALVVELMGNQWNALLIEGRDDDDEPDPPVIRHVLWRREGARPQKVGEPYQRPRPLGRAGVRGDVSEQEWLDALAPVGEESRPAALVRTFAWTSPLNAAALLGAPETAGAAADLRVGYARWRRMATGTRAPEPVLLDIAGERQPYPFPLPGTPATRIDDLLHAFSLLPADEGGAAPPASVLDASLLSALERALARASGREQRLAREISELPDPAVLRATGDLILARYADIPHGASRARLDAFDGSSVEVELDPAEAPHANAARYYRDATKAERAAERLPALLDEARAARARWEKLVEDAKAGALSAEAAQSALGTDRPRAPAAASERGPALPYRVFRSSGGLEIRVGRGSRHNDDLTFRHSSPGDVWLHARHVGGAHVILRWPGPGNPPARDLAEAATLAALHSKARTSGSVPVDWTLRKYVRKPRKAPPGRVAVERVETLFVRPEPALLEALAVRQEP
ncbi:MAG: NFACT RNA binding domain-containing protein [Gemmatimonadales bacterium]